MTVTIPDSPEGLLEVLNDTVKLNEINADGKLGEFIAAYGKSVMTRDKALGEQIQEQVQREVMNLWKSNGGEGKPPVDLAPLGGGLRNDRREKMQVWNNGENLKVLKPYNRRANGAKADLPKYEDSAEFFQAIWPEGADRLGEEGQRLAAKRAEHRAIQNSYGSLVPADGGFLIPETLRDEILSVSLETSIVRPRATTIPMSSLRLPIPALDSTSNVSSVFGGVVAYWTEEAALLTESQASFQRVVLDAKKLTAYAEVPNELMADATAFMGFFDQIFPKAVSWFEDVAFFTGSGVGEPLGFINCPASVSVAKESGQPSSTIVWENIAGMFQRMLPTSLGNAVWIADIGTFKELATMALSVGTGGSAIWLNNGVAGPPMSILGRPVIFTEKPSVLGTTGDINFVDLSYYLIGDRQVMQSAVSDDYKFQNDKTAFRIIERLDGRPWLNSAITPHNSGNTLSPFVQLATR